jgi:hypothetical protein
MDAARGKPNRNALTPLMVLSFFGLEPTTTPEAITQ